MDLTIDLGRLQAEAETRMRDTCAFTRAAVADGELDPVTWLPEDGTAALIYAGPCRLRMPGTVASSRSRVVAGDVVSLSDPVLSIPVLAPQLLIGDVGVMTAVPADDPAGHLRLNLRLRVIGRVIGTDMSAQRVTVEVVTG